MAENSKSNSTGSRSSNNSDSPVIHTSPHPSSSQQISPSTPFAGFKLKDCHELCIPDEELPSKSISELWHMPLKITAPIASASNSRSSKRSGSRKKNQGTPTRRNFLPPTKLLFDQLDSNEQNKFQISRAGIRRSMSTPERYGSNLNENVTPCNPKRLKLLTEECSPYEDLVSSKPALKECNRNTLSTTSLTPAVKKLFLKSQSDSILSTSIKSAVDKRECDPNLIGDASSSYILPVKKDGKHPDLKEITSETLAKLLESKEDFPNVTYKIIDCRYPYEFDGGHIGGALNLHTKKQIREEFLDLKLRLNSPSKCPHVKESTAREILIFHCEFSSRRGPILCRYLRDIDRTSNESSYPFLYYPELYVLYGGYKHFYENFPHLCEPSGYVPMSDPGHVDNYRKYKSQSKLGLGP